MGCEDGCTTGEGFGEYKAKVFRMSGQSEESGGLIQRDFKWATDVTGPDDAVGDAERSSHGLHLIDIRGLAGARDGDNEVDLAGLERGASCKQRVHAFFLVDAA